MSHEIWVVLHILLIGYWLGTDLAVYYISGAIVDDGKPTPVRIYAAKTMLLLDMVPRTCLVLTLLTGLVLSSAWLPFTPLSAWWLWPLLLFWLALTWAVFRREGDALGHRLASIDFAFRVLVIGALVAAALGLVLAAGPMPQLPWLGAKMGLLALIMGLGLVIRIQLKPFGPLFGQVAAGQADGETEKRLQRLIAQVKIPVWIIWISLVAAALAGYLKPTF